MRFIHIADVHLDTPFRTRSPELRDRLRSACRQALIRAVDLALARDAHAFLVAGDLFDGERLSFDTERLLVEQMDRLHRAGIQVVYATGNHDPGRGGLRAHTLEWPESMTVVAEPEPRRITIRDGDGDPVGRVTAAGHASPNETRDLAATFPRPDGALPEVALLHTQVVGARTADRHDPYAPTELDTLQKAGFAYWALGHVHAPQELSGNPPIHYSGNVQGRNPRETGPKGCLFVDLGRPETPEVEFHPLASIRWESLTASELMEAASLGALEAAVEDTWARAREEDPGEPGVEWIVRVELTGACPLHRELAEEENLRTLESRLQARLGALAVEVLPRSLHRPVRPDDHRERQDVLGEALALLEEARSDPGLRGSLKPEVLAGLQAGDAEDPDEYLGTLLEELDGELVARLLDPEAAT